MVGEHHPDPARGLASGVAVELRVGVQGFGHPLHRADAVVGEGGGAGEVAQHEGEAEFVVRVGLEGDQGPPGLGGLLQFGVGGFGVAELAGPVAEGGDQEVPGGRVAGGEFHAFPQQVEGADVVLVLVVDLAGPLGVGGAEVAPDLGVVGGQRQGLLQEFGGAGLVVQAVLEQGAGGPDAGLGGDGGGVGGQDGAGNGPGAGEAVQGLAPVLVAVVLAGLGDQGVAEQRLPGLAALALGHRVQGGDGGGLAALELQVVLRAEGAEQAEGPGERWCVGARGALPPGPYGPVEGFGPGGGAGLGA